MSTDSFPNRLGVHHEKYCVLLILALVLPFSAAISANVHAAGLQENTIFRICTECGAPKRCLSSVLMMKSLILLRFKISDKRMTSSKH